MFGIVKKFFLKIKNSFIKFGHGLKRTYRPIFKKIFGTRKAQNSIDNKKSEATMADKKMRFRRILITFSVILLYGGLIITAWAINNILSTEQKVENMLDEVSTLISDNQNEPVSEPNELVVTGDNLTEPEATDNPNDSTTENKTQKSTSSVKGLGIIIFDSLNGKRVPLVEGATPTALRYGAGHHPKSAQPGDRNNCLIFGHRDTVFKSLKYLSVGNTITITTKKGSFTYKIEQLKVVEPNDPIILKTYTSPMLTLVTCYPFVYVGHAPQRYVVVASLI